ncbi:MAG: hypothetical protein RR555_08515 [Bacteroidales bacterium]
MRNNKKCVLTLDYELFFSKSGSAEQSIIYPTECLMKVLDEVGAKATFFVDTIYLNLLRNSDRFENIKIYEKIEEQLRTIVKRGSRIELHLHPHWLDAYQLDTEWIFPSYQHYKLNSLSEQKIQQLFEEGIDLLNRIGRQIEPNYSVMAFRAGGWCVEPFQKIKNTFRKNGIKLDSSIVPGIKFNGDIHHLDYSDMQPIGYYYFTNDIRNKEIAGEFVELPVNGYELKRIEKITWLIKSRIWKQQAQIFGDGVGMRSMAHQGRWEKLYSLIDQKIQYNQYVLDGYIDQKVICKKIEISDLPFITMVAHPKTLTFSSLDTIRYIANKGHRFVSVKDIYMGILK